MVGQKTESTSAQQESKPKPQWAPRFWEGCDFFAWVRLLNKGRFAVYPQHFYIALIVTIMSLIHTLLKWLQRSLYGTRPLHTPLREAPIFILGHWRTGTTLLHELMILDERHNFPNSYQCMDPNHFLLTESLFKKYLSFLMPTRRPMDNMKAGWDRPQEDEFALCMMGQPSPYLSIAFPNRPMIDHDAYTLRNLPKRKREKWKQAFMEYLRLLSWKDPRRLVLKSPTHSFRVRTLLELFPDAKFIHIVRNPYVVYPSTYNLWKTLYQMHGLQKPNFRDLEERVLSTFDLLYETLEEDQQPIDESHFYEIKYEDLVENPIAEMEKIYQQLELGKFEEVRGKLEQYFEEHANYKTNRYRSLTEQQRLNIRQRWGKVIDKYGYEEPTPSSQ